MATTGKKNIGFQAPAGWYEQIQKHGVASGSSVSHLVRQLVYERFIKETPPAVEARQGLITRDATAGEGGSI